MPLDIKCDYSENVKYDYPDFPVYIRRAYLSAFPNYTADKHWHDDIELIYIISGEMKYNINGTVITIHENEGVFINSRQLHFGFSDTKTECDFICILFHPVLLCTSEVFETEFLKPVTESNIPYIHLKNTDWQKDILKHIYEIWKNSGNYTSPLCTQGLIFLIWKEIAENTDTVLKKQTHSTGKISILKKMMVFIRNNHKEKITLADIANSGGVSKRTCENIFLKHLNQTPIEYLGDYRLRKSTELLKETDMTVLDISMEAGFSGSSYYSESFRKTFGMSPAEYRKKFKNNKIITDKAEKEETPNV